MLAGNTVRDLVDRSEFQTALWWGLGGLALSLALGVLSRWRRHGRPAPVAGLAIAAVSAVALRATDVLPKDLRLGLVLLAAAGLLADLIGRPVLVGAPLAVPGALLIGRTVHATPSWSETLVVVAIVVGGACVASFDLRHGARGLGPPLFALAAGGVYFTVPDTDHALVLLGASAPLALASWPIPFARLGSSGAYAATGLLAWTAATDGVARPASIVGGIASLGLLVAEPLGRALGRPWARAGARPSPIDRLPKTWYTPIGIGIAQLGVVLMTSRVAGLSHEVSAAFAISAGTLTTAVVFCAIARPWRARTETSRAYA